MSVNAGEILTRGTIWLTIAGYTMGVATFALSGQKRKLDWITRLAWTAAFLCLLAHVAFAFHYSHAWSHEEAYIHTARQTDEVIGLNWGGGLYVNYVLIVGWLTDIAWWWLAGLDTYRQRPWPLVVAGHGFLIFIIFNSTTVFGVGVARWAGAIVCLAVCLLWWRVARNTPNWRFRKYLQT